jgi:dipeptidyl aminopeptidase/acylaminoacyl peptidase
MRRLFLLLTLLALAGATLAVEKRAMTVEDMWAMKRIGDVALSPDGSSLVFDVTQYDMESNSGQSDIWWVSTGSGESRQLTRYSGMDASPQWHPDGNGITFLSDRDGSRQIYYLPLNGGEARQLTDLPIAIRDHLWSPDGRHIAVNVRVYAGKTPTETARIDAQRDASKVQARVIDHLLYRHWNRWTEGKRNHVLLLDSQGTFLRDLTPGDMDAPPLSLGGHQDVVFTPAGDSLAFVRNPDKQVATSTNNDLFVTALDAGTPINITDNNEAVDNQPLYSPDGQYRVHRAMSRPRFEADQYDLILTHRQSGQIQNLTESFDRSPAQVIWSPDSKSLFFTAEDEGRERIFKLDIDAQTIETLVKDHVSSDLVIDPSGTRLIFKQQSVQQPAELFVLDLQTRTPRQLTFLNQDRLDQLELNPVEDFKFESFDGKTAHGLMVKPPFFDPDKTYPLLFLIHGGPQGMWSDEFHYRWNSSMFASPGYVVAMINFRGSKGYGQDWCDAVTQNWGGGPYKDLMTGLDALLARNDFLDSSQVVAAGASYGGYMINWIATHTDRFQALVSHAGVFDIQSKYGATEELWFPEWEFNGTPYENPELYEKWSPSTYVKNMKTLRTPTLVIHGQHDYRVPVTQGFQMFTALQRMNVPSKLIYFPTENHFITEPQNARLWWSEVFDWFDTWLTTTVPQ